MKATCNLVVISDHKLSQTQGLILETFKVFVVSGPGTLAHGDENLRSKAAGCYLPVSES